MRTALLTLLLLATPTFAQDDPIAPRETINLLDAKDLAAFTTWLKDTKKEDPRKVFSLTDGVLHVSGDGMGYVATRKSYKDYHLVAEFKWGKRTDGGKYVRNSGILLHATGPDGGAGGTWMSSIECQLAQGCVGDLIAIRGKDADGKVIPIAFAADIKPGPDKRPRWTPGGDKWQFPKGQLWWNQHDPDFKELIDTRGKNDVESPLGEWTKVECICAGPRIKILVNGQQVNECYDAFPAGGKILVQSEGFELLVRKLELRPLKKSG